MNLIINRHFPLSIQEQLKRQIEALILQGMIKPGHRLLSAKDMGLYLDINRNTVAAVYKNLEKEGLVEITKGVGTVVRRPRKFSSFMEVEEIFDQAFKQARIRGLNDQEIVDAFISHLLVKSLKPSDHGRVILVGSGYEILKDLDRQLKNRCRVDTHLMLIQDIEKMPDRFKKRAREYDLVVCAMHHLDELKTAVEDIPCKVTGFMLKTDFQIMNRITGLKPGTTVGCCCVTLRSAQALFNQMPFASESILNKVYAGLDSPSTITQMMESCDFIFITHYAWEHLVGAYGDHRDIIRVNLEIDPENLAYIVSRVQQER